MPSVSFTLGLTIGSFLQGINTISLSTKGIARTIDSLNRKKIRLENEFMQAGAGAEKLLQRVVLVDNAIKGINQQKLRIGGLSDNLSALRLKMLEKAIPAYALGRMIGTTIDFEHSLIGVRKALNLSSDEAEQFGSSMLKLSREIPLPVEELNKIAESGGKLGIAAADLGDFTSLVSKAVAAFDVDAETAGDSIAKLKNIYGLSLDQLKTDVLDVVAVLDDTGSIAAKDLIEFHTRVGSLAQTFGLSTKAASALGSTFLNLGVPSEQASTAVKDILVTLGGAEGQTTKFKQAMQQIGLNPASIKQAIGQDATGFLSDFLAKVNQLPKGDQLGFISRAFGSENSARIIALANNVGLFQSELAKANNTTKTAGYLEQQFQTSVDDTKASLTFLTNAWHEFQTRALLPTLSLLRPLLNVTTFFLTKVSWLAEKFPLLTGIVFGLVASLIALGIIMTATSYLGTAFVLGISKLLIIGKFLLSFYRIWTIAQWAINVAISAIPLIPIILLIAGVIAAIVALVVYWDVVWAKMKDFGAWIKQSFLGTLQEVVSLFGSVTGFVGGLFGFGVGDKPPATSTNGLEVNNSPLGGGDRRIFQPLPANKAKLAVNNNGTSNQFGDINVNLVAGKDGRIDANQAPADIHRAVQGAMKKEERNAQNNHFAFAGL